MRRWIGAAVALTGAVAVLWITRLPTMAECRESGRTVDPTQRHCVSGDGYQQLQEHALGHGIEVAIAGIVIAASTWLLVRVRRLRSPVA